MKRSYLSQNFRLKVITLLLGLLFLVALTNWSSDAISSQEDKNHLDDLRSLSDNLDVGKIPIVSSSKLKVVNIHKTGNDFLQVTLKNESDMKVNGFQISVGNAGILEDYSYEKDRVIAPGDVYSTQIPIQPEIDKNGIIVVAVMYEDGTSEGNPIAISQIKQKRSGEKEQVKRIAALLEQRLRLPDSHLSSALEELEGEIRSLPEAGKDGRRGDFEFGLLSMKRRVLFEIQKIRSIQSHLSTSSANSEETKARFALRAQINQLREFYQSSLSNR